MLILKPRNGIRNSVACYSQSGHLQGGGLNPGYRFALSCVTQASGAMSLGSSPSNE